MSSGKDVRTTPRRLGFESDMRVLARKTKDILNRYNLLKSKHKELEQMHQGEMVKSRDEIERYKSEREAQRRTIATLEARVRALEEEVANGKKNQEHDDRNILTTMTEKNKIEDDKENHRTEIIKEEGHVPDAAAEEKRKIALRIQLLLEKYDDARRARNEAILIARKRSEEQSALRRRLETMENVIAREQNDLKDAREELEDVRAELKIVRESSLRSPKYSFPPSVEDVMKEKQHEIDAGKAQIAQLLSMMSKAGY